MTKNRNRKDAIRQLAADLGISYQEAARLHDEHRHPAPDLSALTALPFSSAARPVNLDLAARLVGVCRDGCKPCRNLLIDRVMDGDRVTIAAIAGAVYGTLPTAGTLASAATRRWHPYAQHAHRTGTVDLALTELDALDAADLLLLLNDALGHWAVGGLTPDQIRIVNVPAEPEPESEPGDRSGLVSYALCPGMMTGLYGREPLPMLVLQPKKPAAHAENLRMRTGWPAWDMDSYPPLRPEWRLRVQTASRSVVQVVRVDEDGWDDQLLWEAPEPVALPHEWFDVLDRVQHVLLCGPSSPEEEAMQAVAASGELSAIVARALFW